MIVYRVGGDPDYLAVVFPSVDDVRPLSRVDRHNATLDPSHVVKVEYRFGEPEEDGVVTDCLDSGMGSTLVLSQRAVEALGPMLNAAGAVVQNEPSHAMSYKTFVCYRQIDALDTERTLYEG